MRIPHLLLLALAALAACDAGQAAPESDVPPAATAPAPAAPAAPPPAAPAAAAAEIGKPAPEFTLTDTDGQTHTLSALKGKTVVLEWFNPNCPFVKAAHGKGGVLEGMAKRVAREDLVWLSINSGAPGKEGHGLERNKEARGEYGMQNPVLLDETGTVGHAYGAAKTPHLFVVDAEGVLVYRGGIDNAPMGSVDDDRPRPADSKPGEQVNYVDLALGDLAAKRPVGLSDTPPYGCTVKYGPSPE